MSETAPFLLVNAVPSTFAVNQPANSYPSAVGVASVALNSLSYVALNEVCIPETDESAGVFGSNDTT